MACGVGGGDGDEDEFTLEHESHAVFTPEHDRQLLAWLHRRPEDWDDEIR